MAVENVELMHKVRMFSQTLVHGKNKIKQGNRERKQAGNNENDK